MLFNAFKALAANNMLNPEGVLRRGHLKTPDYLPQYFIIIAVFIKNNKSSGLYFIVSSYFLIF